MHQNLCCQVDVQLAWHVSHFLFFEINSQFFILNGFHVQSVFVDCVGVGLFFMHFIYILYMILHQINLCETYFLSNFLPIISLKFSLLCLFLHSEISMIYLEKEKKKYDFSSPPKYIFFSFNSTTFVLDPSQKIWSHN